MENILCQLSNQIIDINDKIVFFIIDKTDKNQKKSIISFSIKGTYKGLNKLLEFENSIEKLKFEVEFNNFNKTLIPTSRFKNIESFFSKLLSVEGVLSHSSSEHICVFHEDVYNQFLLQSSEIKNDVISKNQNITFDDLLNFQLNINTDLISRSYIHLLATKIKDKKIVKNFINNGIYENFLFYEGLKYFGKEISISKKIEAPIDLYENELKWQTSILKMNLERTKNKLDIINSRKDKNFAIEDLEKIILSQLNSNKKNKKLIL